MLLFPLILTVLGSASAVAIAEAASPFPVTLLSGTLPALPKVTTIDSTTYEPWRSIQIFYAEHVEEAGRWMYWIFYKNPRGQCIDPCHAKPFITDENAPDGDADHLSYPHGSWDLHVPDVGTCLSIADGPSPGKLYCEGDIKSVCQADPVKNSGEKETRRCIGSVADYEHASVYANSRRR
ncbi:hypothetical protein K458DRAFT_410334 [Lentithecium fluviatile CBS 122367]|uniref:Uncharacterized protein n=1 Tax=Lentithecium fluviatile CBS 122367 TaxID=1168545 RepID=A0A6G1IEJ4_9PLEO|nr:hypothetical protein K458DRAFT_410334 [Lentithecium fluviatile CBS 122367]